VLMPNLFNTQTGLESKQNPQPRGDAEEVVSILVLLLFGIQCDRVP